LFETTWETLQQFSKTKEIQAGMIAVFTYTLGQLSLHLHLYCIVPSGGINKEAMVKQPKGR
jgi:hypothetical protein